MKFLIIASLLNEFEKEIGNIEKKFKVNISFSISEPFRTKDGFTVIEVALSLKDLEKLHDTGYIYLGTFTKEDNDTTFITPSAYAVAHKINLSDMEDELRSFPCNECGKKINRKYLHVFMDKDGNRCVYGSKCAESKFGIDLPTVLRKFYRAMDSLEIGESDGGYGYWGGKPIVHADDWCEIGFYLVGKYGYISNSKVYNGLAEVSTSSDITYFWNAIYGGASDPFSVKIKKTIPAKLTELNFDFDEFVKFANEFKESKNGDFGHNLNAAVKTLQDNVVYERSYGYVAYMLFEYHKSLNTVENKNAYNEDYSDLEIKQRIRDIPVVVESNHTIDTAYGPLTINVFRGVEDNRKYKWFTAKVIKNKEGMTLTGTIKKFEDHPVYGKAVCLNRCIIGGK